MVKRIQIGQYLAGGITGSLAFQSVSTPPTIKAGSYECLGQIIQKTADSNMSLAGNAFLKSWQTLDSYCWYKTRFIKFQ